MFAQVLHASDSCIFTLIWCWLIQLAAAALPSLPCLHVGDRYLENSAPAAAARTPQVIGGIVSAVDVPDLVLTASNGNGDVSGAMGWVPPLPVANGNGNGAGKQVAGEQAALKKR